MTKRGRGGGEAGFLRDALWVVLGVGIPVWWRHLRCSICPACCVGSVARVLLLLLLLLN